MNHFLMLVAQVEEVPVGDLLPAVLQFIGGLKGASALAITAGVIQLALLVFKTSLTNFAGKYKLLIVLGLSVAGALVGAMAGGMSVGAALVSGSVIAAAQVFIHQIVKQFFTKEA